MKLHHQHLRDASVVLNKGEIHILGPELSLTRVTADIRCTGRELTLVEVEAHECVIRQLARARDIEWYNVRFFDSRFEGSFVGARFGSLPPHLSRSHGVVERCDFSSAVLDYCDFLLTDMKSVALPRWPCFSFLDPCRDKKAIEEVMSIDGLRSFSSFVADQREWVSALSFYGPSVARDYKIELNDLKTALEGLDSVVM